MEATKKSSKASRRKVKEMGSKNTIVGEVVQLQRAKTKTDASFGHVAIKQLARTGGIGIKDVADPVIIN